MRVWIFFSKFVIFNFSSSFFPSSSSNFLTISFTHQTLAPFPSAVSDGGAKHPPDDGDGYEKRHSAELHKDPPSRPSSSFRRAAPSMTALLERYYHCRSVYICVYLSEKCDNKLRGLNLLLLLFLISRCRNFLLLGITDRGSCLIWMDSEYVLVLE